MAKSSISFEDFLMETPPESQEFAIQTKLLMEQNGYGIKIEPAKNGPVISFKKPKANRTLANLVFRKSSLVARIYGDNHASYTDLLEGLPDEMKTSIRKSADCKRLLNPEACSSRCPMGFVLSFSGETLKKCRYSGLMFKVDGQSAPFIQAILEREIAVRD